MPGARGEAPRARCRSSGRDARATAAAALPSGCITPAVSVAEGAPVARRDYGALFEPGGTVIERSPGIKAHTYINRDTTTTDPGDRWTGWGDAR